MNWRDFVAIGVVLLMGWLFLTRVALAERYDPTTDPEVRSYLVCIQLASGGGDNSEVRDLSEFDQVGYVTWSDGLGKFLLCQEVAK